MSVVVFSKQVLYYLTISSFLLLPILNVNHIYCIISRRLYSLPFFTPSRKLLPSFAKDQSPQYNGALTIHYHHRAAGDISDKSWEQTQKRCSAPNYIHGLEFNTWHFIWLWVLCLHFFPLRLPPQKFPFCTVLFLPPEYLGIIIMMRVLII